MELAQHVNIDDHVIIAKLDPNMESPDKFIEDYISNLSISPMKNMKPLWDLHILDVKTQETEGTCIFRFHHSLGDGISLMNLLLSCTRKVSDPEALPTLPGNNKRRATEVASISSELGTINDVVLGATQAGISRYLHRRY
nr:O-acyltransferase WSD1-like [Tanacetum cinerariifolium]